MAVPWGLVVFLVGIAYGWATPGRQDKWGMFKMAAWIGLVLAIILGLIGHLFDANPLGLETQGILGTIVAIVILSVLF
ncbi:MAG: hypothetical protein ACT4PT_14535, partial [Methanobacteriota archaeon]